MYRLVLVLSVAEVVTIVDLIKVWMLGQQES
jgi:hypothetical protein